MKALSWLFGVCTKYGVQNCNKKWRIVDDIDKNMVLKRKKIHPANVLGKTIA